MTFDEWYFEYTKPANPNEFHSHNEYKKTIMRDAWHAGYALGRKSMEETELKPCPFCETNIDLHVDKNGPLYYVFCNDCMSHGPASLDTPEKAIAAWNERSGL